MASPAWLALTLQVPTATNVRVVPLTVQTAAVLDSSNTGRPDVDIAAKGAGGVPSVWLPGEAKVMVCAAGTTAKEFDTVAAAAKVLLPAWLALTVQVPTAASVSVEPLTVHTPGVADANNTVRPDVELATSAGGAVPRVWLPGEVNAMVCAAAATANEFWTAVAAAKVALPAWLAATTQVPKATSDRVVPLTVHTLGVVDAKDTASPDVEVATNGAGATPMTWLPGEVKVMVCAVNATATAKECDTTGAGL